MSMLLNVVCFVLTLYLFVLIVRIILTWVSSLPDPLRPVARFVGSLTDPVLRHFRGLIPPVRLGGAALDLSPILLFLLLGLLRGFVCQP